MANKEEIMKFIIEQSNRFDIKNLQFEQDIKYEIRRRTDKYHIDVINTVTKGIESVLDIQVLMIRINKLKDKYESDCKRILFDKFKQYYDTAYDNAGELIDIGNEISNKFNHGLKEQKSNKEYDENTIEYIQEHAFELMKGYTFQQVERIRADIGDLFLKRQANKIKIREVIEKDLGINRSKAEEIAQTELSRAYNIGSLERYYEYSILTGESIKKYWHGFKYSSVTCDYCLERIGTVYDLDDDSETLPAHPNCRCVWLPYIESWNEPVDTKLISRANMLNTIYNKDMMYARINNRLGINYAQYMSQQSMEDYLTGDRSNKVYDALNTARNEYIKDAIIKFDIAKDVANTHLSAEFNTQMNFWKSYTAGLMADNNRDGLYTAIEAIKGVMLLPWNATQLDGWNQLINKISNFN